jgi:transcriptional/translational regulatory protein YebC/TACO1
MDVYVFVDGGSVHPEKNIALSNVIKKVRASGLPRANIESALQKVRVFFFFFFFQTTVC